MSRFKPILIQDATLHNKGRTIKNDIHILDGYLTPYFQQRYIYHLSGYEERAPHGVTVRFYATYDRDVSHVPMGILNIPAVSAMIHFAWAVGVDVEVNELDETYRQGLGRVKDIYKGNPAYYWLNLESDLVVKNSVEHTFKKQNRDALLFSGGLDSTASYLHHNPEQLIMIWGLDIPTGWKKYWAFVKEHYQDLPITSIQTNIHELYKYGVLAALGVNCAAGYYAGYNFNIITFGACPPITVGDVDTIMMSSTFPIRQYGNPDYPFQNYKPHHLVSPNLGWANIKTFDVETDCNRPEKIERFIKPYFEEHGPFPIRVCGNLKNLDTHGNRPIVLNCSQCDKCGRIIATLCNYGIDPNTCGFKVDEITFKRIKNHILNKKYNHNRVQYFWGELLKHLDEDAPDIHGSKAFLEWLKEYWMV